MPTTFECSICGDEYPGASRIIGNMPMCDGCSEDLILETFRKAFERKEPSDYPPKCGDVVLQAEDFGDILSADFVARYRNVRREYDTLGTKVYCQHQLQDALAPRRGSVAADGRVLALSQATIDQLSVTKNPAGLFLAVTCNGFVGERSTDIANVITCRRCNGHVCVSCESSLHALPHDCHPIEEPSIEQIMGEDQVRGRDYQTCPTEGCKGVIQLAEGCNAVRCPVCGTGFCYVCGKECGHNSNHYGRDGCPRFGQPNAENAQHDPPSGVEALDRVVARGRAHLANGGQVDRTFFENLAQEANAAGTDLLVNHNADELAADPTRMDPRIFWQVLERCHREVHEGIGDHRITLIDLDIGRWWTLSNVGPAVIQELIQFARYLLDAIEEYQTIARDPSTGEPRSIFEWEDAVHSYIDALDYLDEGIDDNFAPGELPPLEEAMEEFIHAPQWVQMAADEVLEEEDVEEDLSEHDPLGWGSGFRAEDFDDEDPPEQPGSLEDLDDLDVDSLDGDDVELLRELQEDLSSEKSFEPDSDEEDILDEHVPGEDLLEEELD